MRNQFSQLIQSSTRPLISDTEIEVLLGNSANSRYGVVKRALAKGELLHLRRGLYLLNPSLIKRSEHPFAIAQRMYGPSYISLESALNYHDLIPEAVYGITSVTTKRRKSFPTPIGVFSYTPLPQANFYCDVQREVNDDIAYFIANPWKAICDYVYCHKHDWLGTKPLVEHLRIEIEDLPTLGNLLANILIHYYKSDRIKKFITSLIKQGF